MSDSEKSKDPQNLPRLVCAFAGLFALAVPAFALVAGARLQPALGEIVIRGVGNGDAASASVVILDSCRVASWALLAVGVAAALSLFSLMRKNSAAGTLHGAGRIALALALTGALSAFYLTALLFAVALSA